MQVYSRGFRPSPSCAWLAIFRAVDGVALAKLDFAELVDLPSDKGIAVWVGNERATPIYTKSKVVFLYTNSLSKDDFIDLA